MNYLLPLFAICFAPAIFASLGERVDEHEWPNPKARKDVDCKHRDARSLLRPRAFWLRLTVSKAVAAITIATDLRLSRRSE